MLIFIYILVIESQKRGNPGQMYHHIGTPVLDRWAVAFGTVRREWVGYHT